MATQSQFLTAKVVHRAVYHIDNGTGDSGWNTYNVLYICVGLWDNTREDFYLSLLKSRLVSKMKNNAFCCSHNKRRKYGTEFFCS